MTDLHVRAPPLTGKKVLLVRSRGWVVGGPQGFVWKLVLLAVVHTTGSEGLSGLDVAASGPLPASPQEDDRGDDDDSDAHYTNGNDEADAEGFVLTVSATDVTLHIVVV